MSTIIKDLLVTLKPKIYGKPMDTSKVSLGLTFEEMLEKTFKSGRPGVFRPDPINVDGIWCSPDGFDAESSSVEEFKLTWYSAKKLCPSDDVYWPWLVQIKAYCHACETRYARLWVLYINGDYAPPRPWAPQVYGLEFTPLEILENWLMLRGHAKYKGWL